MRNQPRPQSDILRVAHLWRRDFLAVEIFRFPNPRIVTYHERYSTAGRARYNAQGFPIRAHVA